MMFTTRDTKGHTQTCLTLTFKINHQGEVTDFGFSEILDFENVRIDTKIKSAACIQPELRKVIQWMCVTLSSKVNRQSYVTFLNIFDILDLKNVRIDTKIDFVSCLQPEIRKVMQKVFDLDFQGHAINIEYFHYHRWIPWPRKHIHEKYFQKIRTGRQKSRGVVPTPLGRPKVDFYLGHLRVKRKCDISN